MRMIIEEGGGDTFAGTNDRSKKEELSTVCCKIICKGTCFGVVKD